MQETHGGPGSCRVYYSSGARLSWAQVNTASGQFTELGSMTANANVQYGVADAASRHLYLATSDSGPGMPPGQQHRLSCWAIDAASGALRAHGAPQVLPSRPLHLSLDGDGQHLLLAFHQPAALAVFEIAADGSVGAQVTQAPFDTGVFLHQIVTTPGSQTALVCARGNEASASAPAQPGAVLVFDYQQGRLVPLAQLAVPAGLGPRGLACHPDGKWLYAAFELGNQLGQFALVEGVPHGPAAYLTSTLADPTQSRAGPAQRAGAIQLHPNGRLLYLTNRADQTTLRDGVPVFAGGENNVAVFTLDPATGQPSWLQHIDTGRIEARTLAISPDGRLLIVGNQSALAVPEGSAVRTVAPGLTLFRILDDGRLVLLGRHDCPADAPLIWMAIVPGRFNA